MRLKICLIPFKVADLKTQLATQEVELTRKNDEADKLIEIVGVETEKVSIEKATADEEELKVCWRVDDSLIYNIQKRARFTTIRTCWHTSSQGPRMARDLPKGLSKMSSTELCDIKFWKVSYMLKLSSCPNQCNSENMSLICRAM